MKREQRRNKKNRTGHKRAGIMRWMFRKDVHLLSHLIQESGEASRWQQKLTEKSFLRGLGGWWEESTYFTFKSNTSLNSWSSIWLWSASSQKLSSHFQSCSTSSSQEYLKVNCSQSPLLEVHGAVPELYLGRWTLNIKRSGPREQ